jgi:hypothetical protein
MDTRRTTVVWGLLIFGLVAASEAGEPPPVQTDNSNALVMKHLKELKLSASSEWNGWPTSNAVDGKVETSWYSTQDDSAAKGKRPWIAISFPGDVTVKRVTVLGNRDPQYPIGYSILAGRIELFDKDGKVLHNMENDGLGNGKDFDLKLEKPLAGVRCVRFTSLGDEGDRTPHGDVAVSEMQVE